jgi:hypothetical protein
VVESSWIVREAGLKLMFRKDYPVKEDLDQLGRAVLLSASQNESESDAVADSPFLFTRVRARIAREQRLREDSGGWFSLLLVARRAVPAMALIALLAAVITLWSSQSVVPAGWNRLDDEALTDTRNPGVEQTVLSRNALSRDEVISIVFEH